MDISTLYNEVRAGRPDLGTTDKGDRCCQIILVAIPEDESVRKNQHEKYKSIKILREKFKVCVRAKVILVVRSESIRIITTGQVERQPDVVTSV